MSATVDLPMSTPPDILGVRGGGRKPLIFKAYFFRPLDLSPHGLSWGILPY